MFRELYDKYRSWRAESYLKRYPELAVGTLRSNPELAADAMQLAWAQAAGVPVGDFEAARKVDRSTLQYPILNQLGSGGRRSITLNLPKVTPFNLRRFAFDHETQVLTRTGWKYVGDITTSDTLATLNMQTGESEWQNPMKTFEYRIDGDMVRFLSRDIDALVTPEHMMLGRFRTANTRSGMRECSYNYRPLQLLPASEVEEWVRNHTSSASAFEIPFIAKWSGEMPESYNTSDGTVSVKCDANNGKPGPRLPLRDVHVSLNDLVAFFGIYIAEGSSEGSLANVDDSAQSALPHYVQSKTASAIKKPRSYRVRIAQYKGDKFADIEILLDKLPWKFRYDEHTKGFLVYDKGLWELVHPLGNTYTKYIPEWIKNLPSEYLQIFIAWAIKGDGVVTSDGCRAYFTTSEQLSDDMQEVFQKSGSAAKVTKKQQNGLSRWNDLSRSAPIYTIREKTRAWYGIHGKHVTREEYHGYAHCFDIPNKTVYVRRNGKAFWCGRSEYPPARRAINAIANPILNMDWEIKPVPDPDRKSYDQNDPTLDQHERIKIVSRILDEPNDDISYRVMIEELLEDIIIGGYGALEVAKTRDRERPIYLWTVDGQSIRINADWDGSPSHPRYSQSLGYVGMSVGTQDMTQLKDDELIYFRFNPRTNTPFGLGYLETAFMAVNAWIGAFEYAERRASNTTPNFALFLGENVQPDYVHRFQQYWQQQVEGYGAIPILGGGRSPSVLSFTGAGEDQLWLKWQEFTIRIIAMSFGLSPMRLGLERDVNRNTAEVSHQDDWATIAPVAMTVQDYITHKLIRKILGWRDLKFEWVVRESDEKRQAEILREHYDMNAITVNELRLFFNRSPFPEELGDLTKTAYEAAVEAAAQPSQLPGYGGVPPDEDLPLDDNPPLIEEEIPDETAKADALHARALDILRSVDNDLPVNGHAIVVDGIE